MDRQFRSKQGQFTIGGKTHFWRANLERRWAGVLELCKQMPNLSQAILGFKLQNWFYERHVFRFDDPDLFEVQARAQPKTRGVMEYRPDFKLDKIGGGHIWHETKRGYLDARDRTKLTCMHRWYPSQQIILVLDFVPRGQTTRTRKDRATLEIIERLGYQLIEARPIIKSLSGWLRQMGIE